MYCWLAIWFPFPYLFFVDARFLHSLTLCQHIPSHTQRWRGQRNQGQHSHLHLHIQIQILKTNYFCCHNQNSFYYHKKNYFVVIIRIPFTIIIIIKCYHNQNSFCCHKHNSFVITIKIPFVVTNTILLLSQWQFI
jgi:hypothetical protein